MLVVKNLSVCPSTRWGSEDVRGLSYTIIISKLWELADNGIGESNVKTK